MANVVFLLSKRTGANEQIYADALQYGKLDFLIEHKQFIDFYNLDESIKWLSDTLIKKYDSKYDYILLTGNVMINCLAVKLLLDNVDSVNILLFDGRNNKYLLRVLTKQHFQIYS